MPKLKNPTCANCGEAMTQRASHENKTVLTVFECTRCGVVFYTEDHVPLTGMAGVREDSLAH
jgi:ribosomal protein S27AE